MKSLEGVGVAMVTPFDAAGNVDYDALAQLTNHLVENGADYLVVQGTTGESATLNAQEKTDVLQKVKDVNAGRLPIVLGIGGNNTALVVDQIKAANLEGVTAILSASPYYNKPTQEGIYQHYKKLVEASPLPIILYNVPGRTASNLTAATTLRLAEDFEKIIAIKEASANMDQVMEIIEKKPADFMMISGEDALTMPIIACGGVGVISVVANTFPRQFSDMVKATRSGNLERARELHYRLLGFIGLLFAEGNPGGVKSSLKALSICNDHMRLPLWPISDSLDKAIAKKVREIINAAI